jgi:hypothetical protein
MSSSGWVSEPSLTSRKCRTTYIPSMLAALRLEDGQGLALPRALYTVDVKSASVDRGMVTFLVCSIMLHSSQLALYAAHPGQGRPAFNLRHRPQVRPLLMKRLRGTGSPGTLMHPPSLLMAKRMNYLNPLQRISLCARHANDHGTCTSDVTSVLRSGLFLSSLLAIV